MKKKLKLKKWVKELLTIFVIYMITYLAIIKTATDINVCIVYIIYALMLSLATIIIYNDK